ncbi:hypothetical protein ACIBQX_39215 [Nonomuraea sp. NPDC049714]|uniref:hypothetical protein n=1 Tax=Nonomuraea sp. NPDC049714 TaxID=3364357 RepID=UPI0037B63CF7
MFKRRLAVLGAVAVLALSGLGGSALAAGEPPVSVPGAKVTCTTADGKPVAIKVAKAMPADGDVVTYPATPADGKVRTAEKNDLHVTKHLDGELLTIEAVPATEAVPPSDEPVRVTEPMRATDVNGERPAEWGRTEAGEPADAKKLKRDGIFCVAEKE